MKTEWNFQLLYKSPKDPQIEKDMRTMERAYVSFEKKYRGKADYTKSEAKLFAALKDYEKLFKATASGKPILYFSFIKELDSSNNEAEARIRQFEERLTKAANKVQFFELALGKIPATKQRLFLKSKRLAPYYRTLEHIFDTAKYDLTEPEEKILALKSAPARGMWVSGVESLLNKQMVPFKGKEVPVNEAIGLVPTLSSKKDREALWGGVCDALERVSSFAESEMNAVFTDKKINDELRGFAEPYDATILGYENNRTSVLDLVHTVTKQFAISHRFHQLKKRLLNASYLQYEDRAVSIGKTSKKLSFSETVKIVREAYRGADKRYADILDSYLANGQIDVYPKQGKGGGAFCASAYSLPTFVLLNQVDDIRSLTTLAHEMGHAIHSERSKQQPALYQDYSTSVAETASTFFEAVAFDHLVGQMSKRDQMIALHDKIQDDIATIFRQIAFFNFELELHKRVRTEGWVAKEEIGKLLNEHVAAYLGPAFRMRDRDGLFFVAVSHFRRPFYVYSYAYGQLISKALHERCKQDPSYIEKVDAFLSAGSSKKPEQIFADIGIEVGPKLFKEGLKSIERNIDELERLAKSR